MLNALLDNPVVTKELRGRMRGSRTYWLLFGYVLLLSLILFFSYLGWWAQHSTDMENGGSSAGFTVGRNFFKILFYSQAVMMALITPALTAGAISVEREQRTFELLRGSILRPGAIVWGKLASSVSFVVLLLTSSLPLLSLCFLLGGVSPGEVFFAYLLLIADAFLFGAIGLCWSAYAANTATATVLSYLTLIVFFAVTFPFSIPNISDNNFTPNFGFGSLNPIGAVTGAVVPEHYFGWTLSAWIPAILLNGTLTALLILAAMNRLEDFPAKRAVWLRLVTLLFVSLIIGFGDGVIAAIPGNFGAFNVLQISGDLVLAGLVLALFVPVLVTGDLEGWGGKKRLPRIFGDATLRSGFPIALLLTTLVLGITFTAVHFGLQAPTVRTFGVRTIGRPASFALPAVQSDATVRGIAGMLAAIVLGMSGLGFLLSVLLNNRWSALTLLYLALVLAAALPGFTYATLSGEDAVAARHTLGINSLYLCPLVPVIQFVGTLDPQDRTIRDGVFPGLIGYANGPLWVGTSLVYLTIGAVSGGLGLVLLRSRKRTTH